MIGPKTPKPTPAEERRAYAAATERDENRCVRCGWVGNCQRDHRQNRQPGNTVLENLQLLCGPRGDYAGCHVWKTENPTAAVLEGFAVPSYARPALWPGWRISIGWVQYLDAPVGGEWWRPLAESTAHLLMTEGRTS